MSALFGGMIRGAAKGRVLRIPLRKLNQAIEESANTPFRWKYEKSYDEFKWVRRLMPKTVVPEVPKQSFPTPSGWFPPNDSGAGLPYQIRRTRYRMFPVYTEIRRDDLNTETMEFNYEILTVVKNVDGDVFACESDLRAYLKRQLGRPIATHVNEAQGKIRIKGVEKMHIEAFLADCGF